MSIYIPGKGRQYQQISLDETKINCISREFHSSTNPEKVLEALAITGSILNPNEYESYWGSKEIVRQESGKNIPQVIYDLFKVIETERTSKEADVALIQDPKIDINRSSVRLSVKLLLLNKKY